MRVLHVIPGFTRERGGPSTVVEALSRYSAGLGIETEVLTTDQGARNGEQVIDLEPAGRLQVTAVTGPDRVSYSPTFRRALRKKLDDCDLIHVHSIFTYPVHVAFQEAKGRNIPLVLRPCGLLHPYSLSRSRFAKSTYLAWNRRLIASACTAWHYTSNSEMEASWRPTGAVGFSLPNGIAPNILSLDPVRVRGVVADNWPELSGCRYILYLGRIHPKKRLDLLIAAFIACSDLNSKLVIAGPDECGSWQRLLLRLRPDELTRLVRIDTVSGEKKQALLSSAAALALPSEHENFGNVALEALECGTPVLLSPFVDIGDSLANSDFCERIPLDSEKWTDRLSARIDRAPASVEERQAIRNWIHERFSWETIISRLASHYREALERHARGC